MLVILGPTASGKTHYAVQQALQLKQAGQPAEIISADSRQVYRGMDIGTGKDLAEYTVDGQSVPYHLIDIVEVGEAYNVFRYQQDFDRVVQDILSRGAVPILCGGSGLYIEAALQPEALLAVPPQTALRNELDALTDDQLHTRFRSEPSPYTARADTSTRKRLIRALEIGTYLNAHPDVRPRVRPALPPYRVVGLDPPTTVRRDRISRRLRQRLQQGLIDEVAGLLERGISPDVLIYYGLEYKYVTEYLTKSLPYADMVAQLEVAIHQFAKRQMTFFRKLERDGLSIEWQVPYS